MQGQCLYTLGRLLQGADENSSQLFLKIDLEHKGLKKNILKTRLTLIPKMFELDFPDPYKILE